jgi:hypothetical protein
MLPKRLSVGRVLVHDSVLCHNGEVKFSRNAHFSENQLRPPLLNIGYCVHDRKVEVIMQENRSDHAGKN